MRLGLVRYQYKQAGGAERTLGMLARGLLAGGRQVTVVASGWEGDPPAGLELVLISGRGSPAAWARRANARLAELNLDSWLSLERVPGAPLFRAGDGCHAAWLERRRAYEGPLKRLSLGINPKHRAILALEKDTLTSPSLVKVIANSRLVAGELDRYYGLGSDRVEVLYNPVELEGLFAGGRRLERDQARAYLGLDASRPLILFLGSGFRRKGLRFALAALDRVPEARLLVAGEGNRAAHQSLARRRGVESRVEFLGRRRDAGELIAACDLMVLPTIYDPCANSCLEALALGRPVVTSRANGAAEFITPGVNGGVVEEPADADELARAMESSLGLSGFSTPDLPTAEQWVTCMTDLLEQAAQSRAERRGAAG